MSDPTVAEQLIGVPRQAGVKRVYGVVGDSLNPVVDAIRRTDGIEWMHVRNEEAGVFAAAAEAQLTGRLAVCAGSCGPTTPTWCRACTTRTVGGLPDHGTDHARVNYATIAQAADIHAVRIEQPTDIRAGLEDDRTHPGPAPVDLVTDPNALSIPPHITGEQVSGFALAASKVVLDGGVGRMLELARANLRNIPRPSVVR